MDIYLFLGILIQAYMPDDGGLQELGIADPNFISRRYLPVGGVGGPPWPLGLYSGANVFCIMHILNSRVE